MANQPRVVSVAFAFCGFAVAVVSGLGAGNSAEHVLFQALIAMIVCQFLGMGVGVVLERIIAEHEARYREAHPVPVVPMVASARHEGVVVVDEAAEEEGTARAAA